MSFILGERRRGIIFDLDNTLVSTSKCYENAKQAFFGMLVEKYKIPKEIARNTIEMFHRLSSKDEPFWSQNKLNYWDWREHLFRKSVDQCTNIDVNIPELHQFYSQAFHENMFFSAELKDLLIELRKEFKLAVLTNGDSCLQREKLTSCKADKYFDATLVSMEHGMMKPDSRIFHIACRKIGLENRQCIMVGDLLGTDIVGSQRAGFKGSVLIKGGRDIHRLDEIKPDCIIADIIDIKSVLDKFNF